MEQSSELKDLMLRFYEAFSRGDTAFMERIISNQADVLMIGSDPNEWWAGTATIMQALKAQVQAGIQAIPGDLKAYREGSVGWYRSPRSFYDCLPSRGRRMEASSRTCISRGAE